MDLVPRLKPYIRDNSPRWPEIVEAADWLRDELGISKSIWGDACLAMGREQAAIAVAVVSSTPRGRGHLTGCRSKPNSCSRAAPVRKLTVTCFRTQQDKSGQRCAPRSVVEPINGTELQELRGSIVGAPIEEAMSDGYAALTHFPHTPYGDYLELPNKEIAETRNEPKIQPAKRWK